MKVLKEDGDTFAITVCKKNDCTGCAACIDICPKNAIKIVDSLTAYNAVIDNQTCIKCGACHKVCQNNDSLEAVYPILWKQGWALDINVRNHSSSGGVAQALELAFVKSKGVVCSCLFENGKFIFSFSKSEDDVKKFTGSKYVKSSPEGVYKKIKAFLQSGQKVLFVGLPCQVAAVKKYVGSKNANNLYTVDLICHGTPSPQILEIFLRQYDIDINTLANIQFRENNKFQLKENMKHIGTKGVLDKYSMAFLNSICYTENCYKCKYAKIERVSDITLGDSWGNDLESNEQAKGVSLILSQSSKGSELLNKANLKLVDVDLNNAVAHNHQLQYPSVMPNKRTEFFTDIKNGKKFNTVVRKCYPKQSMKQFVKSILIRTKIYGGGRVKQDME